MGKHPGCQTLATQRHITYSLLYQLLAIHEVIVQHNTFANIVSANLISPLADQIVLTSISQTQGIRTPSPLLSVTVLLNHIPTRKPLLNKRPSVLPRPRADVMHTASAPTYTHAPSPSHLRRHRATHLGTTHTAVAVNRGRGNTIDSGLDPRLLISANTVP